MKFVQPGVETCGQDPTGPAAPPRRGIVTASMLALATTWVLAGLLSGCAGEVDTHGDMVQNERLSQIVPQVHRRDDVLAILGSPSTVSLLDGEAWYYIGDRRETLAFFKPEVLEREMVVVSFDPSGSVVSVDRTIAEDAPAIEVVERETPTNGSNLTMVEQFLGNLGRFNSQTPPRR